MAGSNSARRNYAESNPNKSEYRQLAPPMHLCLCLYVSLQLRIVLHLSSNVQPCYSMHDVIYKQCQIMYGRLHPCRIGLLSLTK